MKDSDQQYDLDLLAFQFLTNELGDSDRESFENRMASDQEAREALARVVQITQTLAVVQQSFLVTPVSQTPATGKRKVQRRRVAWAVGAVAGCLVVLLVAYQAIQNVGNYTRPIIATDNSSTAGTEESDQLAFAWIETVGELATDSGDDSSIENEVLIADEPLDGGAPPLSAPDWMLAAISGLSGNADGQTESNGSGEAVEN